MELETILREKADLWDLLVGISLDKGVQYLLFAGVAWLLGYVCFSRHWAKRKIIPRAPDATDVWRELRYSVGTVFVFGLVGAITIVAARSGWTRITRTVSARSRIARGAVWHGKMLVPRRGVLLMKLGRRSAESLLGSPS